MPITEAVIHAKVTGGKVDFTAHAVFEAAEDLVFVDEIEGVLAVGEIIEDDPDRSRCLVCGRLREGGRLHAVIDYLDWLADPEANLVVVTVYRPHPDEWIDGGRRRK